MAGKQITDFPSTSTFEDDSFFHVHDSGVNKKISGADLLQSISEEILVDATTSVKGVVQLNDATNSTSTTTAATANAVKTVNDGLASRVPTSRTITAGNGLTGGGTLTGDVTLTMGTPTTLTTSTTNSVTSGSHTHAVTFPVTSVAGKTGDVTLVAADISDISSVGMINPMVAVGDIIVGTTGGAPSRLAKGGNNTIFAVNNAGNLGYQTDFCGYGNAITLTNTDDINTVVPPNTPNGNAFYRWTFGNPPASLPSDFGAGYMVAMCNGGTQYRRQMLFQRDGTRVVNRFTTNAGSTWSTNEYVMEAPINGKSYVRKDGAWVESSGGGISTAPVQTFTSANEVSNNITVNCDCTTHNHHPLNFNGSPLPSTAGSFIINLTNLPTSTTELVVGHIAARRLGRKSTVTIQASGFTVAWLATPSFQSGTTGIDYIQYSIDPLFPTVLRLSQVYSRSS